MRFVHSSSLAPGASDWLANSRCPRTLHIFDRACNLVNESGDVLSIVTPQIGNGPFSMVVEEEISFPAYLDLESRISIPCPQLTLGSLIIDVTRAKLWNPCPDWEGLHAGKDHIAQQLTQLRISKYPNLGGFNVPDPERVSLPYPPGLPITQSLVSSLSSALAHVDISNAQKITSKLAGLGSGLTPAGDDYIIGAIYATWIIHPPELARSLAGEIANTAAPLTTSLSAAWLRSAAKGEAGQVWHQFFDALRIGNPTSIQQAMDELLAVGETSGADALAGFIGLFLEWRGHPSNL